MAQQTAVSWLVEELMKTNLKISIDGLAALSTKALEMEKQQILDAWLSAWKDSMLEPLDDKYYIDLADEYYNEIYGKQDEDE